MINLKKVNGLTIKQRTRIEMNKILKDKGDWSIDYYVPGRVLCPFVVITTEGYDNYTGKKIRRTNEFRSVESATEFCKAYQKPKKPAHL